VEGNNHRFAPHQDRVQADRKEAAAEEMFERAHPAFH
jgi:hypothetical protein